MGYKSEMNDKISLAPASEVAEHLGGGVIVKVKSHRARDNMVRLLGGTTSLISTKWVLYGRNSAADSFHLITAMGAEQLKKLNSRWVNSISYPKKVPADLDIRRGGLFG